MCLLKGAVRMAGLVPFNHRNSPQMFDGFPHFNHMLDDFFSDNLFQRRNLMGDTFKIDVEETENEYVIHAEMPGIRKEEINLSLSDGRLLISVRRSESKDQEKNNYIHRERSVSSVSRSVYLADAGPNDIKAKLNDGVLTVTVAKEAKPKNDVAIQID
jgi:HSP20 family protein